MRLVEIAFHHCQIKYCPLFIVVISNIDNYI
jgi:hypothetical protein